MGRLKWISAMEKKYLKLSNHLYRENFSQANKNLILLQKFNQYRINSKKNSQSVFFLRYNNSPINNAD